MGGLDADTIQECKEDCEERSDCFSFLYSASKKKCKVMNERAPTTNVANEDYQFCKRQKIGTFTQ